MIDDAKRLLAERAEQLRTTSGALDRTMDKVRRRLRRRRLSAGIVAAALSAGSLGFFFAAFLSGDPRPTPNVGAVVIESIHVPGMPSSVAADDTAVWIAAGPGGRSDGEVLRVSPSDLSVVFSVDDSQLGLPGARAVALSDETVWVAIPTSTEGEGPHSSGALVRLAADTGAVEARISFRNLTPEQVAVGGGAVWAIGGPLTRVDPVTNEPVASIPVDFAATGVAVSGDGVWVISDLNPQSGGSLTHVDPATNDVIASIPLDYMPRAVAVSADAVWVVGRDDQNRGFLTHLDPATNELIASIPLDYMPSAVAVGADAVWVVGSDPQSGGFLTRVDSGLSADTDPGNEIEEFLCAEDVSLQNAPLTADDPKMVGVYFSCGADAATLGTPDQPVYLAMREIPAELADTLVEQLEGAVRAYIAGPTPQEQDRGYVSAAPSSLASAIHEVRIDGSTAVIDFSAEVTSLQLGNLGTTTATDVFVIELGAMVFQFDGVDELTLQVEGNCEQFWRLMERTCTVIKRPPAFPIPDPSSPASEPSPKWEEGLFGKAEAEFPAGLGYVFENIWRQVIDGEYVAVYVGSRTSSDSMESTGEGVVLVKIIQPDTWKQDFFPVDAPIPGPLRIESVDGHQLTVVSPSGEEAVFDVDTKQFL